MDYTDIILGVLRYFVVFSGMFFLYRLALKMAFMKNAEDIGRAIEDIYGTFSLMSKAFKEIKEHIEALEKHQTAMDGAIIREFEEMRLEIEDLRKNITAEREE
jgi:hypothetical protein